VPNAKLRNNWQLARCQNVLQPVLVMNQFAVLPRSSFLASLLPNIPATPLCSKLALAAALSVSALSAAPGDNDPRSAALFTSATQADLEAALRDGGIVSFGIDATIPLTNSIVISTHTVIDGNGRSVTLDGQNRSRHFVVTNGATLRLVRLALINGRFFGGDATNGPGNPGLGGAIYNAGGTLELIDCNFSNNLAVAGNGRPPVNPDEPGSSADGGPAYGGAIYSAHGRVSVTNCIFASNGARAGSGTVGGQGPYTHKGGASFGGAIYSTNGYLTIVGARFETNLAQGGASASRKFLIEGGIGYGGALAQEGSTSTVRRSVFAGNKALGAYSGSACGGALFHANGEVRLEETLFTSNTAVGGSSGGWWGPDISFGGSALGGAVLNQSGKLEFRNSAIVLNQAHGGPAISSFFSAAQGGSADGGGIFNRGELALINCTVAENDAIAGTVEGPLTSPGWAAGGGISGNATLVNVTMARNSLQSGSSASAWGSSIFGDAILTNTILFSLPGQTNVAGTIHDGGHNICSDESARFSSSSSHNNLDPLLGPLAYNGGFTPTVALLPRSPALSAADATACPPTDQRGVRRPVGDGCDIGAFELAPTLALIRRPDGAIKLTGVYEPAKINRIGASSDLINWIWLGTSLSDADGHFEFEDIDSAQGPWRFYQVQLHPW
jgi:hypothetical protein